MNRPQQSKHGARCAALMQLLLLMLAIGVSPLVAAEQSTMPIAPQAQTQPRVKGLTVYFGLLAGTTKSELRVFDASRTISAIPDTTMPYYGLTIRKAALRRYDIRVVWFPPGPLSPAHFTPGATIPPAGVGLTIGRLTSHYGGVLGLRYHPGDPLGKYRLEIYVDEVLWQRIDYELVAPGRPNTTS